jgi:hypothetical protein
MRSSPLPHAPLSFFIVPDHRSPSWPLSFLLCGSRRRAPWSALRRLMGWQAPGLTSKLKHGATSLANMRPEDFVFFAAYVLAGLVLSLSSFFLTLLEYYGLQLSHLSANSIAVVAIFVHLCEMFMGCSRRCGCSDASSY